jgi:DNA repair protein RecO (recombination protein O)
MPAREVEAIVLRQYAFSEADRIIVFMTRESGTLRAVAPGAKKPRSRLGGCLEPLNHVRARIYAREGAELARIWQCEILHSFLGRNPTPDRFFGFSYFSELTLELAPENSANELLFRLLLAVLEAGERNGVSEPLLRYFEIWALKLNGWLPNYDYCPDCGRCVKDDGFYAWAPGGEGRCGECAQHRGIRIGPESAGLLRCIRGISPEQFASRPQSGASGRELERFTQNLIEWHLEKRLKSYGALREIMRGGGGN